MVINTSVEALLRPRVSLDPDWKERLIRWFKAIAGTEYHPVFNCQLEMVRELVSLENRIREAEVQRKKLKLEIPPFKSAGDIGSVRQNQSEIMTLDGQIKKLRYLRDCILFVGDTIAAHFLEPDAIKHFGAYPRSGFITGKDGLQAELEAMHHFYFKENYLVLLNDLTHSVRVGDLTLKRGDEVRTFEVKSSAEGYKDPDAFRQIMIPIMIHDYMKRDAIKVPAKLADGRRAEGFVRISSGIAEDWHDRVAGRLCKDLRERTIAHIKLGEKHYLASTARNEEELRAEIKELTRTGDWVVANVRRRVNEYPDLPPFSKWFKPETCVDIMAGSLIVLSAFSMEDLARLFEKKGVQVKWQKEQHDLFPIDLSSPNMVKSEVQIGDWHRLRVLYSFLALENFVEICSFLISPEAHERFEAKLREVKNAKAQAHSADEKTTQKDDPTLAGLPSMD